MFVPKAVSVLQQPTEKQVSSATLIFTVTDQSGSISVRIRILHRVSENRASDCCRDSTHWTFFVSSISWNTTQPEVGFLVNNTELGCTCNVYTSRSEIALIDNQRIKDIRTTFPRTERYVPSAIHRAPFLQYPLTRHCLNLLASP